MHHPLTLRHWLSIRFHSHGGGGIPHVGGGAFRDGGGPSLVNRSFTRGIQPLWQILPHLDVHFSNLFMATDRDYRLCRTEVGETILIQTLDHDYYALDRSRATCYYLEGNCGLRSIRALYVIHWTSRASKHWWSTSVDVLYCIYCFGKLATAVAMIQAR